VTPTRTGAAEPHRLSIETSSSLIENLCAECDEENEHMNHESQRPVREGVNRAGRDGLAALAITLLAASLIILLISRII
jgi:hypothetical protein